MPHEPGLQHPRHARRGAAPMRAAVPTAALALSLIAQLAGCAVAPSASVSPPPPAPAQPSLEELMQQAQGAAREGQRERARQGWRAAAKAYPTQKAPWQRLAEDYFDSADYGNAILAAQEVLQRDEQDTLAHSVLAVSGLRLSTVSLAALRERTQYPVGSREEAVGLTRAMRDALGETALVPQRTAEVGAATRAAPVAPAGNVARTAPAARRPVAAAKAAPAVVPIAAPVPAAPPAKPVKPAAKPAGDPFTLLK